MDKRIDGKCCTIAEYNEETKSWLANTSWHILVLEFCPYCGSELLDDGTVIPRTRTIAEVLIDFTAWLTTRDEVLEVGASKLTPPVLEALQEYAKERGLNL